MSADTVSAPAALLHNADDLMSGVRGLWPRMTAFLTRMALENALHDFWMARCPELSECPMRAQLICIREYLDAESVHRLTAAWEALSEACHYHTYELAPTATELRRWHDEVTALVERFTHSVGGVG